MTSLEVQEMIQIRINLRIWNITYTSTTVFHYPLYLVYYSLVAHNLLWIVNIFFGTETPYRSVLQLLFYFLNQIINF